MERTFMLIGALAGLLSVGLGAFGAHGLPDYFATAFPDPAVAVRMLQNWETAARYQMYHALALLAVAWAASRWPGAPIRAAGWCFTGGMLIFSGTLYVLCLTGMRWLGAITPIGGVALMFGWFLLALAAWRGGASDART